ncbi:MAG TPA: hypothetical protein VHF27_06330 [Acidimicrobiales bacterium]|nr:hypothetical protein [Acidimicrobiales bacterium]
MPQARRPAEVDHLRDRLEGIAEELADLAIDRLRAAVDGEEGAAAEERRLTRARRAVEKAADLLDDRRLEED